MEHSRLVDDAGDTRTKSGETAIVSEVHDHNDTRGEHSFDGKPNSKEQTKGNDGNQASCNAPQRKGKVIIHCLRHAEAENNISRNANHTTFDPQLTEFGIRQAEYLRKNFEPMGRIKYILCSSMRRTIETALIACAPVIQSQRRSGGLRVIAWPKLRELGTGSSNTGTPGIFTNGHFRYEQAIDHFLVIPGWERNEGNENAKRRAEEVRKELWQLGQRAMIIPDQGPVAMWKHIHLQPRTNYEDDVEILVVSHANFLKELEENDVYTYYNAMYKTYEFASDEQVEAGFSPHKLMKIGESKVPYQKVSKHMSRMERSQQTQQ